MAMLHRSKAFSHVIRYHLRRSSYFQLQASGIASYAARRTKLRSSLSTDQLLWPSSTSACLHGRRFFDGCIGNGSCVKGLRGFPHLCARNCSTSEFPLPASTGEFEGGGEGAEVDGASLNVEQRDDPASMEGFDDSNLPPYDDSLYPEDEDGDYVDEDPPTDPEEKLLYSPSHEDH
ncbi:hypothetical protein KP509_14G097800 [Ceratopteris richardii]|uniref:Uncharacterized protein n=1 Tax=Ceratopteris richardii TaxID=49495 RepID=A0A8T2TCD2_CERRI|nr:hypothetical protein KP509_14G097800 [Ceratopteris richardii]